MEEVADLYGPALPQHLLKRPQEPETSSEQPKTGNIIGPVLPSDFQPQSIPIPQVLTSDSSEDSDDSDAVGPLPIDSDRVTKAHLELEERALEYQIHGIPTPGSSKRDEGGREEWMLELPEVKKVTDMGLTARQFKTKDGPDFSDRTSWTDTPHSKKEKKAPPPPSIAASLQNIQERERDKAMEKIKRKHEKKHKREKSLLELHQDKSKKKKKVGWIGFDSRKGQLIRFSIAEKQGRETGTKTLRQGHWP